MPMTRYEIWCQFTEDGKIVDTVRNTTDVSLIAKIVWAMVKTSVEDKMGTISGLLEETGPVEVLCRVFINSIFEQQLKRKLES